MKGDGILLVSFESNIFTISVILTICLPLIFKKSSTLIFNISGALKACKQELQQKCFLPQCRV